MLEFILNPDKIKATGITLLNCKDASDAKILFSKKYTIYNILPSMDVLDNFLETKPLSEKYAWFNNLGIVSHMGVEYAKFQNFARANQDSKDRGFLQALFDLFKYHCDERSTRESFPYIK